MQSADFTKICTSNGKKQLSNKLIYSFCFLILHEKLNISPCCGNVTMPQPGPEVFKLFSCSTHMTKKFVFLISIKIQLSQLIFSQNSRQCHVVVKILKCQQLLAF